MKKGNNDRGLYILLIHLESKKDLQIVNIKTYPPCPGGECGLNLAISQKEGAEVVAKGFGSSDCNCPSHLYHFLSRPTFPGA